MTRPGGEARAGEGHDTVADPGGASDLDELIAAIPEGWSRTRIAGETWAVTRTTRAGGKVVSLDAERLGSAEQLGANIWLTSEGAVLKPCEIPAETVLRFLRAAAEAAPADQG